MLEPFLASSGQLKQHWTQLTKDIKPKIDTRASGSLLIDTAVQDSFIVSFVGREVRRAGRLRGEPIAVVPFRLIANGWEAWIGYREVWSRSKSSARLAFSSADLTAYFTVAGAEAFKQVLRAEWAGVVESSGVWYFRPENAGHPHWQIDVTETLQQDVDYITARQLLEETAPPREFGEPERSTIASPPWFQLSRIHFASGMRPWVDSTIAHGPLTLESIRRWVVDTLTLLHAEFERL
ncbi:MAG: hypothetical protein EOR68_17655 [Mesorhizobium sp.]|uniref:hypothetical protein n=1 Tax=Mesorhizobium sp. TaxID=1871066 RepID=UPI000FEA7E26|nr:hypothetical protein [Mesorhizobium sp.]RWL96862.1 MAG: hypothetical protein EOR68_17655 [Mesorhizobium sp.]TIP38631.1 MAG: hypothetical protein E5X77_31650 [Mesorhizobium sp.]